MKGTNVFLVGDNWITDGVNAMNVSPSDRHYSELHDRFDHIQQLMTELEAAIDKTAPRKKWLQLTSNHQTLIVEPIDEGRTDRYQVKLVADAIEYDADSILLSYDQILMLFEWLRDNII